MSTAFTRITILAVVVLIAIAATLILTIDRDARAVSLALPPTAPEVAVCLHRVGITSEALAASGVRSRSLTGIVNNTAQYLVEYGASLEAADAAVTQNTSLCQQLQRAIQAGTSTPDQRSAYQTALSNLANAQFQQESLLSDMFDAATSTLTPQEITLLTQLKSNSDWKLPTEFLVVERSEADWIELRDALDSETSHAVNGTTLDAETAQYLAVQRANVTVATAQAHLTQNLALLQTQLNNALGSE
jgi:hypothetical protein